MGQHGGRHFILAAVFLRPVWTPTRTNVPAQGEDPPGCRHGVATDVIFAERRGQSQKPEEIYELIEELVPNGTT